MLYRFNVPSQYHYKKKIYFHYSRNFEKQKLRINAFYAIIRVISTLHVRNSVNVDLLMGRVPLVSVAAGVIPFGGSEITLWP